MIANITPGTIVDLTLTDGNVITGDFVSINSKGYNVKVNGKVVSRAVARVAKVEFVNVPDNTDDLFADVADDTALTTAELAAIFDTSAKALRVQLRAAGLGVGKGHVYGLTPADVRPHVAAIRAGLADA